jgi:hypothetical protein
MSDPFKSIIALGKAKVKAQTAHVAAREMARHCDARIKRARTALELINTFAWSAVSTDTPEAAKELQRRIDKCREILRTL